MKNVQVTINPTEIKHIDYTNAFTKKPGEKIALQVKQDASIRLNPSNPVSAIVLLNVTIEDPDKCISLHVETITGVTVSTFIDDLEGFIRTKYLPTVVLSSNEKIRATTCCFGIPVRLPNPVLGEDSEQAEGIPQ